MYSHYKTFAFSFVYILIATACSSPSQEQSSEQAQETQVANDVKEKPSAEQQSLVKVVDHYLLLKDALVASSLQEAQAKATSMLEVIDATNMMGVQQSAKQIAAAENIETQRAYFDSLSVYVYKHLESQNGEERTLYKQFCPMAFDDRGAYWLSNAKEIRNPYFGDKMLSCGQVEETLTY